MGTARSAQPHRAQPAGAPAVTREILAEAAVWVTRLHGPARSRQMELDCLAWQARSAAHREAFEACTQTWMDVPNVTVANAYAAASQRGPAGWGLGAGRWALALGVAGMVVGAAAVWQQWSARGTHGTGVGEQQVLVLDDGTRLSLNTRTQVRVELGEAQRTVSLQAGEALFEVAPDATRPFVVRVAGSEVVALGTVFAVRFTAQGEQAPDLLAVTLLEGKVALRPAPAAPAASLAPQQALELQPGERVQLRRQAAASLPVAQPQRDRPVIDQVVAWKRSEALFEDVALADAVAEMNRYSRTPIVLVGDVLAGPQRVSGRFRTGDNAGFARAVAVLHGLAVAERGGRLELTKPP